ncbi:ureidoglycolate hydrolase [Lasiosphaeria hispida]|uniref:Ureidoglycolate hydrolase n=1 Tax=Lasiosphaeria hispida TaxID=260671 RepID=A0AAJ0MCB8_9PEZI|nr:ureidoglycolate hydrolase [Lasiosphaeria hispida]
MAKFINVGLKGPTVVVDVTRLSLESFAPFGYVVENARPDVHPSAAARAGSSLSLPFNAISANQGFAIKYQDVTHMVNLYDQAPSGRPAAPSINMFVCAARTLTPPSEVGSPSPSSPPLASPPQPQPQPQPPPGSLFSVAVLERHPYTTQTFIPLSADPASRYLVIVAPTLPPAAADEVFSVPTATPTNQRPLPGRGLPDIGRLHAFIATGKQAVTYGAGTWHAPMVALGPPGTAVDFVVIQFANGVPIEDCQEVFFQPKVPSSGLPAAAAAQGGLSVRLPTGSRQAKL